MLAQQLILGAAIAVNIFLALLALGFGLELVLGVIGVNLILISTFWAKTILIFGFTTNIGNIFYATTFFAIQLLVERYDKRTAIRGIWSGIFALFVFVIISQMALNFGEIIVSSSVNNVFREIFGGGLRLALAIGIPFLVAQYVQVNVYEKIQRWTGRPRLWLRSGGATISGQFIDSILFFSIAFLGRVPDSLVIEMMLVGFFLKVVIGILSIPFLYFSRVIKTPR
jgi:queuosine precursor transporter